MEESRNGQGRFTPEHTDEEILAAVRAHEPAATSEVGDEVDMTRQGADRRLRRLRDAGRVNSKKIGASLVWFTSPGQGSGSEGVDGVETDESASDTAGGSSGGTPTDADTDPERRSPAGGESAESADAETVLRELSLPGSGGKLDAGLTRSSGCTTSSESAPVSRSRKRTFSRSSTPTASGTVLPIRFGRIA